MTVPVNHVGMSNIQDEFGGSSSDGISISEYYRGGSYVPLNQLPSIHSTGPIPLLSGGVGQTISIGMFRGTAKKFQWIFNITQDRFNTFNVANELAAVGWDGTIPVDVTINISTGVYVIPVTTSTFAIDAIGPFDPSSKITINNNGFIFGRGGKGGMGGVYPNQLPSAGENGGDAIRLSCRTTITNNGVIAGGGGGGGGGSGMVYPRIMSAGGENYYTIWRLFNGPSGGGGAPFGAAGDYQGNFGSPTAADHSSVVNSDFTAPSYIHSSNPSAGTVNDRGMGGIQDSNFYVNVVYAGFGGKPGSSGQSSYNPSSPPLYSYNYTTEVGRFTEGAVGGDSGFSIRGGNFVEWSKFGTVKGKIDNFGTLLNASNQNLLGTFFPNATQPTSGIDGYKGVHTNEVYRIMPKSTRQGAAAPSFGDLTNQWPSNFGDILYSYSSQTNWADRSAWNSGGPSSVGSPLWFIKYVAVCETSQASTVTLNGLVDDRITYVSVNGITVLNYGNAGLGTASSILNTGSFTVPAGSSIIEVGVRNDNGNSGTSYGNSHMIFLRVLTVPFNQILVNADQWYVKEITNL